MADKRISALTAAATLDKTEVFPIVQGGVTVKATIAQALAPLTILQSDAGTMLAGVPAFPIDGQVYLLTSLGITGVDHIRTVGIVDANTADFVFNNNCEAYLDGLGVYVPCTYDVATNKINVQLTNKMFVSVDGLGGITIDSVVNNEWNGITFSAVNTNGGEYEFTPSQTLQTIFTAVSMHCEQVITQGSGAVGFASTLDDYPHDQYYYTTYNTTFSNDGTITFLHNLITFIGYIKN